MTDFPHTPPAGYCYEFESFKANVTAIWILNTCLFAYNNHNPVRSIWGFYNHKKKQYFAPVNSKTIGKQVDIQQTTPYTAMQLKYNPLTAAFV